MTTSGHMYEVDHHHTNTDHSDNHGLATNEERLETIFHLIQLGNDATETSLSFWYSAECYIHACELLQQQLVRVPATRQSSEAPTNLQRNDDDEKLQQLYQEQIDYYYKKTRSCIVKALQQQQQQQQEDEGKRNEKQSNRITSTTPLHITNPEEHQYQFHILHRFYSFLYPVTIPTSTTGNIDTTNTGHDDNNDNSDGHTKFASDKEITIEKIDDDKKVNDDDDDTTAYQLEQRLRQLNATLPTHMKSDEEIVRQRNEQLRRIGVHVPNSSTSLDNIGTTTNVQQLLASIQSHHNSTHLDDPVGVNGEDDPVESIIAQVTEEVRLFQQQQPPIDKVEREIMDLKNDIGDDQIIKILQNETNTDEEEDIDDDDDDEEEDDDDDTDEKQ